LLLWKETRSLDVECEDPPADHVVDFEDLFGKKRSSILCTRGA
jgi:hypothetical protein